MKKAVFVLAAAVLLLSGCGRETGVTAGAALPGEQPQETAAGKPQEIPLLLATYNIKHCDTGTDTIAAELDRLGADVVGLEEVDRGAARSGGEDQPALLAEKAGYPYYRFCKAMDLQDGAYGTALLSRYPITDFFITPLPSGNGEPRSFGHAVLDIRGVSVDVFVTHLSYEDRAVRRAQMEQLAKALSRCRYYVLLGDLNCFDLSDLALLKGEYYVNREGRSYPTFRNGRFAPDNIVVSRGFSETDSGMAEDSSSDHKLLYAAMTLTP